MEKDFLVTICCLTFNHRAFIANALDGFLAQETSFETEIIVYDDASTDGTTDILITYEKRFPQKIKLFLQNNNQYSKGENRIIGKFLLPHARGKYIAICEGDDYWTDVQKLQKQVSALERNLDCSFSFHNAKIFSGKNEYSGRDLVLKSSKSGLCNADIILGNFLPTASLVLRNFSFGEFPKWYYNGSAEDFPLVLFLLTKGYGYYIDCFMSVYRHKVFGSCSEKLSNSSKEIKMEFYRNRIELLNEFNTATAGCYAIPVNKMIIMYDFKIMLVTNGFLNRISKFRNIQNNEYYHKMRDFFLFKCVIGLVSPHLYLSIINSRVLLRFIKSVRKFNNLSYGRK